MISKIKQKAKTLLLLPLRIVSYPIKRTLWYQCMFVDVNHETYPDNTWYRSHDERNFDVVNLGSSGGKWAFDYTSFPIKGMNWAQQPQTLEEDFGLLRCYHSILRRGGVVIFTIMPFTSLNKKTGLMDAMKYLKIDTQGEPVQPYLYDKAKMMMKYPILMGKPALKAVIKKWLKRETKAASSQQFWEQNRTMTSDQLEEDALKWMNGWKRQFNVLDWEAPLTETNQQGRSFRIRLMQEMIDFCIERGYKPVWVIPPVASPLAHHFTPNFVETYITSYLKDVHRDVLLLNYLNDREFLSNDIYFNSLMLNKRGSNLFTKRVLHDVGLA